MGDYFHGWRRKIGTLSLILALVSMVGWIRSPHVTECIEHVQGRSRYAIASCHDRLSFMWQRWPEESIPPWVSTRFRVWSVANSRKPDKNGILKPYDPAEMGCKLNWRWESAGFYGSSGVTESQGMQFEYRMIPYWFIVFPLILFSAYLLLAKPKVSKIRLNADGERPPKSNC